MTEFLPILGKKMGTLTRTKQAILLNLLSLWICLCFQTGNTRASSTKLDISQCRTSLGMQVATIPDESITASSSYDYASVGPTNARIRTEKNGGAWCPKPSITPDTYEYLQIDLYNLTVITLVETQGRFGNGQGQEFTEQYLLEYQREEGANFIRFRNRRGQEIFQGNTNTYLAELREVDPPIIARKIRFVPYSTHPRTVCMRVELYGCPWKDGTISYDMPQGDKRGAEVDLFDFTYDGKIQDNFLSGGMGQLTDGEEGPSNFRLDPQALGMKGYEWVGWKNETTINKPVEIIFKFDTVRNFSSVSFHCNNFFSKEVRVFRMAKISFSVGGKYYKYGDNVVTFIYMRDELMEFARWVKVKLSNLVGKYVKVSLTFDARWMLMSEVHFESEPAIGNFSDELPPPTSIPTTRVTPIFPGGVYDGELGEIIPSGENGNNDIEVPRKHTPSLDDKKIGIIVGALAALIIILILIVLAIIWRQRTLKHNNNRRNVKPVDKPISINLNDLHPNITVNGKLSNGNMYNSIGQSDMESDRDIDRCNNDIYHELDECLQSRKLPDLPPLKTPESTGIHYTNTIASREYAIPDVTKSSLMFSVPPSAPVIENPYQKSTVKPVDPFYATSDILTMPNIQGVSGSNVYAVPNPDLLHGAPETNDQCVIEFPRENLKFIEKLGEGQFGEVHLCEAQRIIEYLGDDFLVNRTASRSLLVAVKMLRKGASNQARLDFQKEVKIMSRLKDPNIVRVLGMCSEDDPPLVIVEYMKFGDLNQFIQQHIPENIYSTAKASNAPILSYGCLIFMASQVASGMKYLESLNMVHRDLATRNCLVGHQYTIKISDFGMSRSLYQADYYRIEGRAVLPIRWMAWESVLLGKFTSKSDVWSFAVTLWEVLTFAKIQPYEHLTDEQVIENCGHFYRQDGQEIYPPIPSNCPKEIYDLMRECWNQNDVSRPSFREIHMFLQRKNMGYNPKDEIMSQSKMLLC
ncbi:discoidin domain-containing receptor 2-like isoform X3 [Lineus longissimus]|uniref:discoidin domain-containing receptor 2-like isoform X3 n=1 Tax=Lineus longissimus TaxID=88925 RepID=UPI00315C5990